MSPPESTESRTQLEVLSDLAQALVTTTDLDEMLARIVSAIGKVLDFYDCVLYLWDPEEEVLVQRAAYGPKRPAGETELINPIRLRLGEGIVGSVAESGIPALIADTREDPRYIADLVENLSEITVPIRFQEATLGVIDAESERLGAFSESDLVVLGRFADLCAPAIVNARRIDKEQRAVREALQASEQRYQAIVERARDVVYTTDARGRITYVNPAGEVLFGRPIVELHGVDFRDLISPEARADATQFVLELARGGDGESDLEIPILGYGGAVRWVEQTVTRLEANGRFAGFQAIVRDVTDRRTLEKRLEHLANHDPLTGLFNRYRFEEELRAHLERSRILGLPSALLWIDLDQFKDINDSQGHHEGDKLLVEVAQLLTEQMRAVDVVSRFGGDEFAILVREADAQQAALAAARILDAMRQSSFELAGRPFRITASIGIALLPEHGDRVQEALARADIAMYEAKETGRNRFRIFQMSEERRAQPASRISWVERLRKALDTDLFELYLQPIRSLADGSQNRFEVLVRLSEADGTLILPGAFISIAERYGLIHDIDRWVVTRAIHLLRDADPTQCEALEVNLSGKAFSDGQLLPKIRRELDKASVDPSRLVLEITETAAVADTRRAQRFIETLQGIGCRFALDDFGVGFSSFYYLKHLPIDFLKIDGSFIRGLKSNEVDQHLVRSMVEIARALGKETIAEFVEDAETLELVRRYGLDHAQGFEVGRPQPAAELLPQRETTGR